MAAVMPSSTLALCPASASGDNITLHAYPLHPLALLLGDRGRRMYAVTDANILASTPYTSLLPIVVNTLMISVLPPFFPSGTRKCISTPLYPETRRIVLCSDDIVCLSVWFLQPLCLLSYDRT